MALGRCSLFPPPMFARLAGALKRKDSTKFEVTLRIHSLSPWPATAKFKRLAVKWQRGDKARDPAVKTARATDTWLQSPVVCADLV